MKHKYAVIGNPIAHSKSPSIHIEFAKQVNHEISYEAILAPIDGFAKTVEKLITDGYEGLNVTVPFKFEAYQFANQLRVPAKQAGAVNTLIFKDNKIIGDNTDGIGLVRDIEKNIHKTIQSKRVLIIGAGGAAEGVLHPILDKAPSQLVVANRRIEKANAMIKKVKELVHYQSIQLNSLTFDQLNGQKFDIVINATSAGLSDASLPIPNDIYADGSLAYDMMYGLETPFLKQAREARAQGADGLGMLVEQAAESFYLWRGVRPDTAAVLLKMRT